MRIGNLVKCTFCEKKNYYQREKRKFYKENACDEYSQDNRRRE